MLLARAAGPRARWGRWANRCGRLWVAGTLHLDRLRHAASACLHLENIKTELLDNPLLCQAYPRATGRGPVWRQGAIVLRNGVTIEAFGTLQRMRGRRR